MHTHVFYLPRSILSHNPPLCCPPTPCPPPTAWLRSSAVAGQRPLPHALHRSHHLHQCNPHSWSGCREHHGHCLPVCQQMYVCMWVCQKMLARVCVCMCVCECVFSMLLLSACVGQSVCVCAWMNVWVHLWVCKYGCGLSCPPLQQQSQSSISSLSISVSSVSVCLSRSNTTLLSHSLVFSLLLAFFRCPSLSLCLPCSLSLGLLHCLSWPAFQQRDQWAKRKRKKDRKKKKEQRPACKGKRRIKNVSSLSLHFFYSLHLSHFLPAAVMLWFVHPYTPIRTEWGRVRKWYSIITASENWADRILHNKGNIKSK